MNWINGRPDDWHNPWVVDPDAFESGASAMLAALLKWLFEPCKEHPTGIVHSGNPKDCPYIYGNKHKDCPQCMAELRGEK
jgi:hypothetical protein